MRLTIVGLIWLLTGCAVAQVKSSQVVVIPKTDLSATGTLEFRDKQTTPHVVGFRAPGTVSADYWWTLPAADAVGALCSDGSGNLTISSCGGSGSVAGGYIVTGSSNVNGGSPPAATEGLQVWYDTTAHAASVVSIDAAGVHRDLAFEGRVAQMEAFDSMGNGVAVIAASAISGKASIYGMNGIAFTGNLIPSSTNAYLFGDSSHALATVWTRTVQSDSGALNINGASAVNGNIVLSPGNVAGNSTVVIPATRTDQPALRLQSASGTTTGTVFVTRNNSGTSKFWIMQSGDASCPDCVVSNGMVSILGGGLVWGAEGLQTWYDAGSHTAGIASADSATNVYRDLNQYARIIQLLGVTGGSTTAAVAVAANLGQVNLYGLNGVTVQSELLPNASTGTLPIGDSTHAFSEIWLRAVKSDSGALNINGASAGNGNIVLSPGAVASNASVVVNAARVDQPGVIINNIAGTTTSNAFEIRDSGGVVVFKVIASGSSGAPNYLVSQHHVAITGNTYDLGATSNRWRKLWATDASLSGTVNGVDVVLTGAVTAANQSTFTNGIIGGGDIGSVGSYFTHGFFGGTLEATILRTISGNPGSVTDYFDWKSGGTSIFDLRDSSNVLVWRYSNLSSHPKFGLEGFLDPLTDNTYDIGESGGNAWRSVYLKGGVYINGTAAIDSSRNGAFVGLTVGVTGSTQCLQVNSSGVVSGTGSTCGSSGVTSLAASSPLVASSSTGAVTISCPTCLTTAGGQTISASDTFAGGFALTGGAIDATGLGGALNINGASSSNGNIVLAPGNVAGNSSVVINATRADQPALRLQSASGTTTGTVFATRNSSGTAKFWITQSGDANCPDCVVSNGMVRIADGAFQSSVEGLQMYYVTAAHTAEILSTDSAATTYRDMIVEGRIVQIIGYSSGTVASIDIAGNTGQVQLYGDNGVTSNSNFFPAVNNTYSNGTSSKRWSKVWGVDADFSGTLTTNVTGSTQCLQANSSGVVSGFSQGCVSLSANNSWTGVNTFVNAAGPNTLFQSNSGSQAPYIEIKDSAGTPNRWFIGEGLASATDGRLFIYDTNNSIARLDVQKNGAITLTGATSGNGNIVLAPGNVAGNASVVVTAARTDQPGLQITSAAGTTVGTIFATRNSSGVAKFWILQSGDATCPDCVSMEGRMQRYNGQPTAGNGLSSVLYDSGWNSWSGSGATQNMTVNGTNPAAGTYRITFFATCTTTGTSGNILYTWNDGTYSQNVQHGITVSTFTGVSSSQSTLIRLSGSSTPTYAVTMIGGAVATVIVFLERLD